MWESLREFMMIASLVGINIVVWGVIALAVAGAIVYIL